MRILLFAAALAAALPISVTAQEAMAAPALTFREAVGLAVSRHPAVAAARSRLQAAEAWSRGAGAQPNPEARLSATAGDPSDDANIVAQRWEIAGQTGLRAEAARAEADAARHALQSVRRSVARETATAYYGFWEAASRRELAAERLELARRLEETSRRRLELGEIAQNAHLRTEVEVARAEADLAQAEGDVAAARSRLNLLLGRAPGEPVLLPAPTEGEEPRAPDGGFGELPTPEALRQGVKVLPELEALRSSARAAGLEADLAGRARFPDLELSGYRSRLFGRNVEQGVQISVLIPLWDYGRISASEARLRGEAQAREHDVSVRLLMLETELLAARESLLGATARRDLLRGQVERSRRLAEMARIGYEAGLLSLPEVLDAQQAFRLAVLDYVAAEAAVQRAHGDLHWSSGGALPEETP